MVVSRLIDALQGGRNSLDMPVAALAGLAVAFLAFAAPANLLAGLVEASGISSIIAAAEPPLGMKARMALGAAGALVAFAVAFLLLRWLGRFGSGAADDRDEITELEVPRLRRRDIHPDAPARPPLLAVHELGEPELELDQLAPEPLPAAPEPPPASPEMPLAAEQPPPQLLARKPDRQAAPQPTLAQSFEPAPPLPQPPASLEMAAKPTVADVVQNDQARAYALSQRNWADFETEPQPEPEPEPEVEPDHAWLADSAQGSDAPWSSSSPEAWGFSEEDAPASQEPLAEPEEAEQEEMPQSPEPQSAWEPPFAEPEPWTPAPAGWATDAPVPAQDPIFEPEPVDEIEPVAETDPLPEPQPMSEWTAGIEAEPPVEPGPLPETEPLAEWTAVAEPEPMIEAEPTAEPVAQWAEPPEPLPIGMPQPADVAESQFYEQCAPEMAEDQSPPLPVGSFAELMERLEKGLARHRMAAATQRPAATPAARPGAVRPISPDRADDRLQHAIEKLQRFASRQD